MPFVYLFGTSIQIKKIGHVCNSFQWSSASEWKLSLKTLNEFPMNGDNETALFKVSHDFQTS